MRKRGRASIATIAIVSSVLLLLAGMVGVVNAQQAPASHGQHVVTGTGQPATATVVSHSARNEHATPKAAAAQLAKAGRELPFLSRVGAARYAQIKANAKASAPKSGQTVTAPAVALAHSFMGQQNSNATCPPIGCNPPDMGLAASTRWVFQGANTSVAVYDTHGALQPGWPKTFQDFFGVPDRGACDGGVPFTSDPRDFYDPNDGHFWAAALEVEGAFGVNNCPFLSLYWIAVSETNDPNGIWNVYAFDMTLGTTNGADFTMVGFDGQRMYFSANMFTQDGSAYSYAEIFGADKRRMERGQDVSAPGFFGLTVTGPAGSFLVDTVQPALTEVRGSGPQAELFADTFNGFDPVSGHGCTSAADACRGLAVWALSNRNLNSPHLSFAYVSNTKAYDFPPAADQTTCTQCLDSSDLRISATPVYRDGALYAAWETGVFNGMQVVPGILWSQVRPELAGDRLAGAAQQRGDYFNFSGDDAVVYPALMPNGRGTLFMVFDHMGSATNPEVRLTALHGDGSFASPGLLVKAGEAPYRPTRCGHDIPVCRWGDFSATSLDSFTANDVWFGGEFANASGFRQNWGTWIGAA